MSKKCRAIIINIFCKTVGSPRLYPSKKPTSRHSLAESGRVIQKNKSVSLKYKDYNIKRRMRIRISHRSALHPSRKGLARWGPAGGPVGGPDCCHCRAVAVTVAGGDKLLPSGCRWAGFVGAGTGSLARPPGGRDRGGRRPARRRSRRWQVTVQVTVLARSR